MNKKLTPSDLRGILPAIPTPVTADDKIDDAAVRAHINYLISGGVNGVVPLGGTGEYGSLGREQRERMVAVCVDAAQGRVPVVAGVLDTGFYDAQSSGAMLAAAGASALMVVTPYYTNPTQQGIRDYFLRFADSSAVPIILYEIPYRTRIAIQPEVIHELSQHENIIGMKACNTDMYHFLKVVSGVSENFSVLSGEDILFPLHLAAGAKGGIIVTSSVIPKTWKSIYETASQGRIAEAIAMHRKLIPLLDLSFAETNPAPLKSVWDLIGVDAPRVLAPLVQANPELQKKLRAELVLRLKDEQALS